MRRWCGRAPSSSAIPCARSGEPAPSAPMRVQRYSDARAFNDRIVPALESAEHESNVLLGAARRLADRPDAAVVMASVEEDGRIVSAALLAPPFNLLISPASVTALDALA